MLKNRWFTAKPASGMATPSFRLEQNDAGRPGSQFRLQEFQMKGPAFEAKLLLGFDMPMKTSLCASAQYPGTSSEPL